MGYLWTAKQTNSGYRTHVDGQNFPAVHAQLIPHHIIGGRKKRRGVSSSPKVQGARRQDAPQDPALIS